MTKRSNDASQTFERLACWLDDMDDAPEALVELVELAGDEDVEGNVLENAAELMSPSDRRAARAFCVRLLDGPVATDDPALAEGIELVDAILDDARH